MTNYKKAKISMVYRPGKGKRITPVQAKMFGERIAEMMEENGKYVTPDEILADATHRNSVFHKYFDWDDSVAASKYRLQQARELLQSVNVEIKYANGNKKETRAFVNVNAPLSDGEGRKSVYVSISSAMDDVDLRPQLLNAAMSEVISWRQRYSILHELSLVFTAIDKVRTKYRK